MGVSFRGLRLFPLVIASFGLVASPAEAQDRPAASEPDRKPAPPPRPAQPSARRVTFYGWEVEAHAGGFWSSTPGGTVTLPVPGNTFPMFNGAQTRSVRSWFFGDGSALFNANSASVAQSARITPLDSVLDVSSVKARSVNPFGVRVSRALTPRLRVEFALDALGRVALTEAAQNAARATRSSFQSAFDSRLAAFSTFTGRLVTSDVSFTDGGREMLATGALIFDLRRGGGLMPYVVAGGGPLIATGDPVSLNLTGDYRFVSGSGTPYRQTDTVDVRFEADTVFASLVGAGFRWPFKGRSGIRVDFRALFASSPVKVLLNWNPVTIPGTPANTIVLGGTPGIQISTNGAFQSTLAYQRADEAVEVAKGDGIVRHATLSIGYYVGFSAHTAQSAAQPTSRSGRSSTSYDSNRRWEVAVKAGGLFGGLPSGGTRIAAFPVGGSFTSTSGISSRYAASWMFGDGAVLINQIAAGFIGAPIDRLTTLDPVLTAASLERSNGTAFGVRISRRLTPRIRAEFAVETAGESLTFTDASRTAIEATRGSFERVWNGIIATGGGVLFTNSSVTGTADVREPSSRQTYITGGIEYLLAKSGRLIPYATAAVGVSRLSGSLPEATITGTYQFLFFGTAPLSEQDRVRIHFSSQRTKPAGAFGGGVRYFLSARHGITAEVRVHLSGRSIVTLVDASPSSVPGSPPFSISSTTSPSLVFSNTSAVRGNLSAPAITNLETFSGSGIAMRSSLTAGYFVRF